MRQQLFMLADRHSRVIEDVRGLGLLMGLKCRVKNTDLLSAMREQKLLAVGASDNVVRLLPPLIITEAEIGEAVARINRACECVQP
jgi:acetylornithine/N-succinyldiaminopimelate aminotransferase